MTDAAQKRSQHVKSLGLVGMKKSGRVVVDWDKAVRSSYLKKEVAGMAKIRDKKK